MMICARKLRTKRINFVSFILFGVAFYGSLKSTIADVPADVGIKSISSSNQIDKISVSLMMRKKNHNNRRRLDRPATLVKKDGKVEDKDESPSTTENTLVQEGGKSSENDPGTTSKNETQNNDDKGEDNKDKAEVSATGAQNENKNEVVSLPDYNEENDSKTEAASKKGQCFSAFSCNQCKVIADRLEKDSNELFTCAWKSQAQITEEVPLTESSGNNTSTAGSRPKANDLDIKSGLCVGVYKTYAENEAMAGKNLKCDAKSLEAAARNAAKSVSAVKSSTTEYGDPDLLFGTSKRRDHSYTFFIILGLLMGSVFIKKKIQKGEFGTGAMGKMLEVMNGDVEMGNNNVSNRFARERYV